MNNRLLRIILIITPIAIVIAAAALLFVIILILNPEWELTKKFIYIRETVTATSMAAMVVATLILAYATFGIINNYREREERQRKENLLKEIAEWSANVLKHCSSVATGFNNELERSKARDEYLTLKFAGENFVASIENETSFSDLLAPLRFANNCFNGPSFNSLQDDKEKRANLEKFCKNARTEAFKLLREQ